MGTECLGIDGGALTRSQMIDGDAENDLRTRLQIDLVARLVRGIGRKQQQQAPILGVGAALGRKRQLEFEGLRLGRLGGETGR